MFPVQGTFVICLQVPTQNAEGQVNFCRSAKRLPRQARNKNIDSWGSVLEAWGVKARNAMVPSSAGALSPAWISTVSQEGLPTETPRPMQDWLPWQPGPSGLVAFEPLPTCLFTHHRLTPTLQEHWLSELQKLGPIVGRESVALQLRLSMQHSKLRAPGNHRDY